MPPHRQRPVVGGSNALMPLTVGIATMHWSPCTRHPGETFGATSNGLMFGSTVQSSMRPGRGRAGRRAATWRMKAVSRGLTSASTAIVGSHGGMNRIDALGEWLGERATGAAFGRTLVRGAGYRT